MIEKTSRSEAQPFSLVCTETEEVEERRSSFPSVLSFPGRFLYTCHQNIIAIGNQDWPFSFVSLYVFVFVFLKLC